MTRTEATAERSTGSTSHESRRDIDSSDRVERSSPVAAIQGAVGNRAVAALFRADRGRLADGSGNDAAACHSCRSSGWREPGSEPIQLRPNGSGPSDRFEREAERAAEQVVRGWARTDESEPSADESAPDIQQAAVDREAVEGTDAEHTGQGGGAEWGVAGGGRPRPASTPPFVDRVLGRSGRPIDADTRTDMERRFGHDFSGVRVHTGPRAAASARALGAAAYTVGEHVAFDAGRYRPTHREGRRLLAHELAHVIQQGGGQPAVPGEGGRSETVADAVQSSRIGEPVIQRNEGPMAGAINPLNPSCVGLMNMPGSSTSGLGRTVQTELEADFETKVGPTEGFAIPGATADPLRTEGRPGDDTFIEPEIFDPIDPHPLKGTGIPDIAYRNGDVMELIEVKPAHWGSFVFAEEQVSRYVRHGNAESNERLRSRLGVSRFERMPSSRYQPPSRLFVGGRPIYVTWCGPGVILYKPGRRRKPREKPRPHPVWEPFAALAGVVVLRLIEETLRQLNPGKKVRAALAMIAAAVVMSSSTAMAEIDPSAEGQDPISALYKAMEDNGVPPPPALKERIENNPELRERLEASIASGDPTAAQAALNRELVSIVDENADEFSDAELEALMTATEVAGGSLPESERTVEGLKRAIERRRAGAEGGESGGEREGGEQPAEPRGETTAEREQERARGESPSERWLPDASAPKRRLFDAMVEQSDVGPRVTARAVDKFRNAVPDLTRAEAGELISRLRRVEGETIEEITAQLSAALSQIRADESAEESQQDRESAGPVGERDTHRGSEGREETPREVVIEAGLAAIEAFEHWNQLDPGDVVYVVDGSDPIDTPVGEMITATIYVKRGSDGVRASGSISFRVRPENDSPPRDAVVCRPISSVQLVYETGTVRRIPRSELGDRHTLRELDL